ncbi:MAG TPA: biotin transporter BioY [Ignavibacteriaceae bacterium]|nr:biotin transporter BioY [Ignavibacteriaceae bacterium]
MSIKENVNKHPLSKFITQSRLSEIIWIFSFTIITAIAAQITIPVKPVPFTLQTLMVLLSGAFLGPKRGAYSQLAYLALGVMGFPVFAQIPEATIGFARLFGPTGGYLLSFPIAAFVAGYLVEKNKSYINFVFSMLIANMIILFSGALFLGVFYLGDIVEAFKVGVIVFMLWEVVKVFIAAGIYFGVSKKYSKSS